MIGCLLLAFALCAPAGYQGPAYGYGQGYPYAPAQTAYYAPQPAYYAPQPVYYYPPPAYPYGVVPAINLRIGGWSGGGWAHHRH